MDAEFLLSSLLSEDNWLDDLSSNQDGGKSSTKGQETEAPEDLFKELGDDSLLAESDPLPEWMSEKVSLSSWLDVADMKPSEILMDTSLPIGPEKMDLVAPTTTTIPNAIPPEELFDTLFVDNRYAPQPPSPGEAQAPDLVALSPGSLILTDDDSSIASSSPSSPIEVEFELDPSAPNMGASSLTTIDLSTLIQAISSSASCTTNGFVLASTESPQLQEPVAFKLPEPEESPKPRSKAKSKLKSTANPTIRKSKKRDQNKKAATRYRHKKRSEMEIMEEEQSELETKNKELNDKVDSIAREIKYLKDLLAEVYKVKGEIKVMTKK